MEVMIDSTSEVPANGAKDRKRREKLAARACVLCNQAHTACDDARPCRRCVSKNIAHLCRDAEPRKRGRPAKLPEQYDLEIQEAQRRNAQNALHHMYQHQPLSLPTINHPNMGYNMLSFPGELNLDYDTQSLLNDIPLSPFEPSSLLIQDLPSPLLPQVTNSPPIQLPEINHQYNSQNYAQAVPTYESNNSPPDTSNNNNNVVPSMSGMTNCALTKPIYPPGFGIMGSNSGLYKFTEEHLGQVFTRLANRAGYHEMTQELKNTMLKVVQFYAPLVSIYGSDVLEMCPVKLMSVSQTINENTLPVIVAGCFFILTCNSPALDLTGLKKNELGRGAVSNWKFIFDLIHKDDAIPFIKRSVDCLTSFTDLDRMKVRLLVPDGEFECVVSETVHRNSNGVPLFSSFTFIRIDDLK